MLTTSVDSIVIDTHALLWYFEDSPRLSSNARSVFGVIENGGNVGIVPTIVLAELMYISDKRRTSLDLAQVISTLQTSRNFSIASFDLAILTQMSSLTALELHDRIIVATAMLFGSRLITRDETIRDSGVIQCIW